MFLSVSVTDICSAAGLSCEYTCDNSTGAFVCVCPNGYELESNGQNCTGKQIYHNPKHECITTQNEPKSYLTFC